ncbi:MULTISPECIES: hypothetical protein [unclassified Gilliamella]|uniref:hypothetical protein n=1 Tax=unclassified Gilliamella TaxID=2685620 RepID=UPI00226A652E|nr:MULTISPECIES: hypothetical protein [unclassified Gilliamella]MCX8584057.1 hypothetical protein [Gilliamella sp. B3372]MCX8594724.1 hypothetical protein [Gilliamella sp. B3367]
MSDRIKIEGFDSDLISAIFLSAILALIASEMHSTEENGISMYLFHMGDMLC